MVEKNIVYCGIDCVKCPIYIATKNNDEDLRKKTAEEWGMDVEKLYCDMCQIPRECLYFCLLEYQKVDTIYFHRSS